MHVATSTEVGTAAEPPAVLTALRRQIEGFTRTELALIALALTLPLAYHDSFLIAAWTPRMALLLFALPLGACLLISDALHGDAGSIAAVGFLVVCTLSTAVNGVPLWVLHGGFGREASLVYLLGLFGFWAIGKRSSADAVRFALGALGIGLAINGVIAVLQVVFTPGRGALSMLGSRPAALLSNPVYFGACFAGATVWAAQMAARGRLSPRWSVATISFFAMSVTLSGSRIAAAAAMVGLGAAVVTAGRDGRRWVLLGSALGIAVGTLISGLTDSRGVGQRTETKLDGRLDIWQYAWDAFLDRPITGYGLGQFRRAVQPYFEPEFVARHANTAATQAWPDAHNLIVQYTVIGGLPAIALLGWFAYAVTRTSRGPMAWAGLTIAITWLFQPVQLATGPFAMLLFGMAAAPLLRPGVKEAETTGRATTLVSALLALGLLLGASLVVLDNRLNTSRDRGDAASFTSWARIALDDPLIAALAASITDNNDQPELAIEWSEVAVRLEPFDVIPLSVLAIRRLRAGDEDAALDDIRAALEIDPWHPEVLRSARIIGLLTGDIELESEATYRTCVVDHFGDTAECSDYGATAGSTSSSSSAVSSSQADGLTRHSSSSAASSRASSSR